MGTRVLLPYQKSSERDTCVVKLPRSGDVVASCREKLGFTSCHIKAGLRHANVERLPRSGIPFYFLAEGDFLVPIVGRCGCYFSS